MCTLSNWGVRSRPAVISVLQRWGFPGDPTGGVGIGLQDLGVLDVLGYIQWLFLVPVKGGR